LFASFHPKAPFYKEWKHAFIAIIVSAIPFVIWDEVFTYMGLWGFNERYIIGIRIGSLPIEEIMFFICVPYACLFTYHAVRHLVDNPYFFPSHELVSFGVIILMLISGLLFIENAYPAITFLALSFFLAFLVLKQRVRYLPYFYFAFMLLLIPYWLVTGVLTGFTAEQGIMWHNEETTTGVRLGAIYLEDSFYSMLLMLANVSMFEWLRERH